MQDHPAKANSVSSPPDGALSENRLCSVVSKAAGEDPIGSATPFSACLLVEVAPPWKNDVTGSTRFPEGLAEAALRAQEQGVVGKLTALLPDPEYTREGHTRFMYLRRPSDAFAAYEKEEFLVPREAVLPFVETLSEGDLSRFEEFRQYNSCVRELLVCTHGARDVCCGKFGYPIYKTLREEYAETSGGKLRVWRTSHIGGHRFAPTLIDFPEGRYWGRLEPEALENLVVRDGPTSEMRRFYRGWAGLGGKFEQIAEREILVREGWGWTEHLKRGRTLEVDEDAGRAKIRIEYTAQDGSLSGSYEATVEGSSSVMTLASSGAGALEEARQYRVSRLEEVP